MSRRLEAVDLLRGAVMVLMALDHVRAFFGAGGWDPGPSAGTATFLTRWITHFCAPVFVLLAGVGASLSLERGRTRRELAWFSLTRGAWLVVLDATPVSFVLLVLGRVPLFFYVVHLYLIHLAAASAFASELGASAFHVDPEAPPPGFGVSLPAVYAIWIAAIVFMVPLCRWFDHLKRTRRSVWLSYL